MRITKVELTEKNISDLHNLDVAVMPADVPYPKQGSHWWIAKEDGKAVGFCGLKCWNSSTAFLCRAGVLRNHRGTGLHRKLVKVREKAARDMGISLLVTYVSPYNLKSANNLIKCGYKLYQPQTLWGCAGALYFRKCVNAD